MKKFFTTVSYEGAGFGLALLLDHKPAWTPAGNALALPNEMLAQAVAQEWDVQGEVIRKNTMPLTQIACVALDLAAPKREELLADILPYGETDLICYRAGDAPELAREQADLLDPVLIWAQSRFGVVFTVTEGVMPVLQPEGNRAALEGALAGWGAWKLAALAVSVKLLGSLVLALALAEGRIDAAQAFRLSHLEELYETQAWGADEEKEARLQKVREELAAVERFVGLL